MNLSNKRLFFILAAVGILLLIPFTAMQFTNAVNWSPFDFLIMGILLLGTGLLGELVLRKIKNVKYQFVLLMAVAVGFLLVWAELAVGIFGTPFAGS